MKICLISDIHIEFYDSNELLKLIPEDGYDVLVLAGDISESPNFVNRICEKVDKQIIYVLGNHEYYGDRFKGLAYTESKYKDLESIHKNLKVFTSRFDYFQVDDVFFMGGVNWPYIPINDRFNISRSINDFRTGNISVDESCDIKIQFDKDIKEFNKLVLPIRKKVGLTHFIPGEFACSPRWKGHPLNVYFVSEIEYDVYSSCDYWLFGHGHDPINNMTEGCKFISNPLGYPHEGNYEWKPLIIEI